MQRGGPSRRERLALAVQRTVGWLAAPLWVPATVALMRLGLGWRLMGAAALRREMRALWAAGGGPGGGPLLVCANHLTLVDSALVAWALASPLWFLRHWAALPWNVPERRNFASSWTSTILIYLMKCVPVTRGGERAEVAAVLARLVYLLGRGEVVLLFPEGGRSRSGRVELENAAWGVGRVIGALPGCRVLCVYLRGERQVAFGDVPPRGERFHVRSALVRPESTARGLRRSHELARQVVATLALLEAAHVAEVGGAASREAMPRHRARPETRLDDPPADPAEDRSC
jgi:hypothetical protein